MAIGLGIVRSGDKRSAHFRNVPAGHDAKPKRLFCLNVTRRKVLHGGYTFKLAFDLLSSAEWFAVVRHTTIGSAFLGEPGKVSKYGCDKIAMTGVGGSQPPGVQIQDVARLGGGLRPGSRDFAASESRTSDPTLLLCMGLTVRFFDTISYRILTGSAAKSFNPRFALYSVAFVAISAVRRTMPGTPRRNCRATWSKPYGDTFVRSSTAADKPHQHGS